MFLANRDNFFPYEQALNIGILGVGRGLLKYYCFTNAANETAAFLIKALRTIRQTSAHLYYSRQQLL